MTNIFNDNTKMVPKSDGQIIRVDMETQEIGGRKSSLPNQEKSKDMSIQHVPNAGTK